MSGAGDFVHCNDGHVQTVVGEINRMRREGGLVELQCDEKATGAAVNWSEMQCDACVPPAV